MPIISSELSANMNPHRLLGRRYEGQHCQADGVTPSQGDEFWAWDTGYVLREKDGAWSIWFRTLPVERELKGTSTFTTASF
jgi:hypothetical protein